MSDSKRSRLIDRINPVVLLEARQLSRSRFSMVVSLLFLLVILVTTGLVVFDLQAKVGRGRNISMREGANLFGAMMWILSIATLLFVPLFVGARAVAERGRFRLLYITALQPGAIMRGKAFSAMTLILQNILLCLPMMVFAVMLRGVDYLVIGSSLLLLFVATLILSEIFLLIACVPCGNVFRGIMGLFALFCAVVIAVFMIEIFGDVGSSKDAMVMLFNISGIGVLIVLFLHQCTVALISPVSSNRALRFRIWTTGLCMVSYLGAYIAYIATSDEEWFAICSVMWMLALFVMTPLAINGPLKPSIRIRKAIPKNPIFRILVFPFYSGSAAGLIWLALLALINLMVLYVACMFISGSGEAWKTMLCGALYVGFYIQLAILLQKTVFEKLIPYRNVWFLAMLIFILAGLAPVLATFMLRPHNMDHSVWSLGSFFHMFWDISDKNAHFFPHLIFGIGSLLVLVFTNFFFWWFPQFLAFKPLIGDDDV